MTFNRPPRIQTPLPIDKIQIPPLRDLPSKPGALNWISIVLPLGALAVTVVFMMTLSGGGSMGSSYLFFLPMMVITYVGSALTYFLGKRKYKRELIEAQEKYVQELKETETLLRTSHNQELSILLDVNPDPDTCLQRVQQQDPRIGERRPTDPDFLDVRLGLGELPTSFEIAPPDMTSWPKDEFREHIQFINTLMQTFSQIPGAPILARLEHTGSIGLAGRRPEVLSIARAIMCQLLTHHWPSEVQVALAGHSKDKNLWSWLRHLPHMATTFKSKTIEALNEENLLQETMIALEAELQSRQQWIQTRKDAKLAIPSGPPLPRLIVLFDYLPLDYNHPGLTTMLEEGKELGIYGIFLAERREYIPGECGAVLHLQDELLTYQETGIEGRKAECTPDLFDLNEVELLAQALARIDWPRDDDISQPPAMIDILELFGANDVEGLPIESWWDHGAPFGHLQAPIGRTSATADLIFDLNDRDGAHGPHGLIGGMTGSGKSEALKTILLALAVTHNPYDLNFALVDFKGGAAFNELAKLPHTVGVVTDIETHATYAERVIQSLTGEIEHRKRILERARNAFGFGRSHIDEYHRLTVKRPFPHLVVAFDEFAEFKQRNPEEIKRLISIARQGRSLGVHLILATQNIEAAVDPQILQNSTFRICLRVSDVQDSVQMAGVPDAVHLTRGRAYFKAKNLYQVQLAFTGGEYISRDDTIETTEQIVRIWPGGRRETIPLPKSTSEEDKDLLPTISPQPTEAQAIVELLVQAARNLHLKKPPPVWPDPLPNRLYLPDLINKFVDGGWDGGHWRPSRRRQAKASSESFACPILGLYDDPIHQQQPVYQLDPTRSGGHLLVLGSAGSGKSTLLRTLVASIALVHPPNEVHIYIIDFGGQSTLKVLEDFPHVGAVVTRFEPERVERLIHYIHAEVSHRNNLFRENQVDNLPAYNVQVDSKKRLPSIYLIIDGFVDLKRSFDIDMINSISSLVSGGVAIGLYMVVSTSLQGDVPNELFANINSRLTFHQADQMEYFRIVGQPSQAKLQEDLSKMPPPGRGLLRGTPPLEFQAALPTSGKSDKEQAEELGLLAKEMGDAWMGTLPPEIRTLPLLVTLLKGQRRIKRAQNQPRPPLLTMLGQDHQSLKPISLALDEDGPTFLIAGTSVQSGKTTLLRTWLIGLAEQYSPEDVQFILIDFHARTLVAFRNLPHRWEYIGTKTALGSTLDRLNQEIGHRREALEGVYEKDPEQFDHRIVLSRWPNILVVIDDYENFAANCENERNQLFNCVVKGTELGVSFIITGNTSELPRDFDDPFMQQVRKHGCGMLLGGDEGIDQFNFARRPSGPPVSSLPPGRGYMIRRGQVRLFQAAAYWKGGQDPMEALSSRVGEILSKTQGKY
jgi:S-DNA-T family DNA segregation ATPase FtsK/SpoIIIE